MLVWSDFEMAKKKGLFDDLFRSIMLIAIGYFAYGGITLSSSPNFFKELQGFMLIAIGNTAYGGITLSSSPNFFKELQGSWFVFLTLSFSDLLVLDTIYYMSKKGAQRHGTVRSPKAGASTKRILGFSTHVLVPLTIVLTVLVIIYFFIVFIASAYMLTLSKSLMLYMFFFTTALMYFAVMYYGTEVWRYKKA